MNALSNRVQLIGHLGKDPEVKTFDSGKKVARLLVATKETYRNSDGTRTTETQWHNLVAWEPKASFSEKYLKKGNEVAIEGKLIHRTYDDKEGKRKYITEVVVNDIMLLKSNGNGNGNKEKENLAEVNG